MFEPLFLASDDDEMETKKKALCQGHWNEQICSSHLGKGQVNSPNVTEMEKKKLRSFIHCILKRQLSDWTL